VSNICPRVGWKPPPDQLRRPAGELVAHERARGDQLPDWHDPQAKSGTAVSARRVRCPTARPARPTARRSAARRAGRASTGPTSRSCQNPEASSERAIEAVRKRLLLLSRGGSAVVATAFHGGCCTKPSSTTGSTFVEAHLRSGGARQRRARRTRRDGRLATFRNPSLQRLRGGRRGLCDSLDDEQESQTRSPPTAVCCSLSRIAIARSSEVGGTRLLLVVHYGATAMSSAARACSFELIGAGKSAGRYCSGSA
jgi:hypothetical protein